MRILQLVAEARSGDAVTRQAFWMAQALRGLGHELALGADAAAPELQDEVFPASVQLARPWDLVLDHYSIGADYHELLAGHRARRWLVYHNITPAALLAPWSPAVAARCDLGRTRLAELLPGYERALADSSFNAQELLELGGSAAPPVTVLPICVEPPGQDSPWPLPSLQRVYAGRGPLLLFVGRIAPQKNHVALLRLLRRIRDEGYPGAELLLAGDARGFEDYERALLTSASALGLGQAVHLLGKLPEPELWSLYRLSDLLCCVSRHEGFCVPLVEAFLMDLPVVAAAAGAVPETVGDAALLAPLDAELELTELCLAVLGRDDLKADLIQRGRRQARRYSYSALCERLSRQTGLTSVRINLNYSDTI